jgi:tetratricopeptide (TPR) repeat protein
MEALYKSWARILIDNEAGDWTAVLSEAALVGPLAQKYRGVRSLLPMTMAPVMAYAQAKRGDIAAAESRIAGTPPDCYVCLRTHARIAELKGDHAGADGWFARAVQDAPSIPLAYSEWGQALLSRDNPDAAIVKFTLANQKGPHFADPIEMWGEALMAKNRSDLALAKFTEAEKYAPNWGRLHLKWGEALGYTGYKDRARAQYQKASTLDLNMADNAELTKAMRG